MKNMMTQSRWFILFLFIILTSIYSPCLSLAGSPPTPEEATIADIAPDQADSTLAKLSDEQVRSLLLVELSKGKEAVAFAKSQKAGSLIHGARKWLHILDSDTSRGEEAGKTQSALASIAHDLTVMPTKIGNGSAGGFFLAVIMLAMVFTAAYLAERFVRRFTDNFSKQFQKNAIPDLDGPMRFLAGIMRSIPIFIHIFVYCFAAIVVFSLLPFEEQAPVGYLFLALLFTLAFYRLMNQIFLIVFAPKVSSLRVIPMDDSTAAALHRGVLFICTYTFATVMFLALLMELEPGRATYIVALIIAASLLIGMIIYGILRMRTVVRNRILKQSDKNKTRNWVVEQFAQFWHVPTILYFLIIWIFLVNNQLSGVQQDNPAFLLSLMVLPLFVVFDGVGQWVIRASMNTLQIYDPDAEEDADEEKKLQLAEAKERERKIAVTAGRVIRLTILAALLIWAAKFWGYDIPYVSDIAGAVFKSLITMALGLTAWRFISSYIEKKMAEATPEETEQEGNDDEMGGATQRGRSYTLLPMLRKVLASTLLIMVSLTVLSSLGVDIGPLLAGAGVLGLAIGFGAQKLVSDVLSGFFYLLDDAFRVGEYIQAGSVSGAVESITLRNVMLRHHRGMLQIVPHSSLGSITNFMRGGIIEKFNLEFPYDADVDKIRKVIKKVGQAMLKEEEFADDFINPIKSAGVREITGSVMTIRVKFKAHSGCQFVIKREAFRRITEALNAKGIYYAHRKVIVELPEEKKESSPDEKKRLMEAGAAAELT